MKFICEDPISTVDEILTYNDILYHVEKDNNTIDNDIKTYEPLALITQYELVTCADYAKQNKLLDTAGWTRMRCIAKSDMKIERMVN
jgi:hypothetical protein